MIWNAAIYCTRVERDPFVVALRCTLVYLFGSWNTLVQAAAPQCWMGERRPVRIVVGFAAGGATDISARLTERLGHQFIIENRPGPEATSPLRRS
jgi:tripartite-type tricarboxylate transporter receptor subunit TctC